jgi:hypothetical protein
MCSTCEIKNNTTVGSVVKIVRRCQTRTYKDKGKHLENKQSLVYVTKIAARGEGFYGQVINLEKNRLQKTNAHFRDCEFESTNYKWNYEKLLTL